MSMKLEPPKLLDLKVKIDKFKMTMACCGQDFDPENELSLEDTFDKLKEFFKWNCPYFCITLNIYEMLYDLYFDLILYLQVKNNKKVFPDALLEFFRDSLQEVIWAIRRVGISPNNDKRRIPMRAYAEMKVLKSYIEKLESKISEDDHLSPK